MRRTDTPLAVRGVPLTRADPRVKLAAVLAAVLVISTFPAGADWRCVAASGILAGLWLAARVSVSHVVRRLTVATPFIVLAAVLPVIGRVPEAGALACAVLWKAYSAILLLSLLAATTPLEDIIDALRRLRVPQGLALTIVLMHRYLFVLLEEWRGIVRARECRTGGAATVGCTRIWANQAAMVFVRGWERAENVAQALLTRGFRGDFPRRRRPRPPLAQWVGGIALPLSIALLRIA